MKKQIILLNGPSSSGKSTLSKYLQKKIEEEMDQKYEIVSIDHFMKISTSETIYEDDVFEISYDMCKKTLELLQIYSGVIIDHVITSERIFNEFWEVLGQLEILFVKVTCPLEILEKRELERKNRCLGSAKSSYTYLYPKDDYDLVVDTDSMTLKECCEVIFKKII